MASKMIDLLKMRSGKTTLVHFIGCNIMAFSIHVPDPFDFNNPKQ